MQKDITFSEKMGVLLKTFRISNNKKAIDLATFIDKSPAYINKLEKGEIKKIDEKLLKKILFFITDREDGIDFFYQEYTNKITKEDYDNQSFLMNYDYNSRLIPVSSPLINFINGKLIENNCTSQEIIQYINKNEDIFTEEYISILLKNGEIKYNKWEKIPNGNENGFYIFLKYNENKYDKFLKSKQKKETYMFIYAFLYHLLKYENRKKGISVNKEEIKRNIIEIFFNYKFFSLEMKIKYLSDNSIKRSSVITKYDMQYDSALDYLIKQINFFSDRDILNATEKIELINHNFNFLKNRSFVFDFMSLNLEKTKLIKDRKEFINDLQDYINNYYLYNNEENDD